MVSAIFGPDARDERIAEWREQWQKEHAVVRWLVIRRDGVEVARYPHDGRPHPPVWEYAAATADPLVHERGVAYLARVERGVAYYDATAAAAAG